MSQGLLLSSGLVFVYLAGPVTYLLKITLVSALISICECLYFCAAVSQTQQLSMGL